LSKAISMAQIANFQADLDQHAAAKVIERSVSKNGILASSQDIQAMNQTTPVFSIDLDTGDVANQKQSGRCWMFAALNIRQLLAVGCRYRAVFHNGIARQLSGCAPRGRPGSGY